MRLFVQGCLLVLAMCSAVQAAEPVKVPEPLQMTRTETDLITFVNIERSRRGLHPLVVDGNLLLTTRRHAHWMAGSNRMQHGSYPVGEIIAMGQTTTTSALNTWLNSSGHRAHVLSQSWRRCGVAAYTSPSGRVYWCMQFLR